MNSVNDGMNSRREHIMEKENPNYEIAEVFYRLNIGVPIGNDLVARAFELILTDPNVKARDTQLGALLTGLMVGHPNMEEVVMLIKTALDIDGVMKYKPTLPRGEKLVGVAGSGKKGHKTFNISTPACLVASAAGVYVAKPGSTATSSISGSKDFLNTVGARPLSSDDMIEVLLSTKFGMFSIEGLIPKFDAVYGGKMLAPTPLSFALPGIVNPVVCDALFYGLSHPNISLSLSVFLELGYRNVMIVSSSNDKIHYIDELSTLTSNFVGRIREGEVIDVNEFSPTDITQRSASNFNDLKSGASLIENVQIGVRVLQGKLPGPCEDTVATNASGIIVMSGKVATLREGFELAIEAIRSGAGFRKLEEFIDVTKGSRKALSTIIGEG